MQQLYISQTSFQKPLLFMHSSYANNALIIKAWADILVENHIL